MDIRSLEYLRLAATDLDRWRTFAFDAPGFAEGSGPEPDVLYPRMDNRPARAVAPTLTAPTLLVPPFGGELSAPAAPARADQ